MYSGNIRNFQTIRMISVKNRLIVLSFYKQFSYKPSPPKENVPDKPDIGFGNAELSIPHPPSATVPPLPECEGYSLDDGFCDSAFGCAKLYVN